MDAEETGGVLRALGPLETLDLGLLVVRRGGPGRLLRAWGAALPLAAVAIGVYYVERVEGVHSLRVVLALALVLGYWLRGFALASVAREYALLLRPTLPVTPQPPAAVSVLCTVSVVGMGLWVWLWPLCGLCALTPFAMSAGWPFLALRGAIAPSWLARATCASERGFRAFGQAFDDTAGMRGTRLAVELLTLLGAIGLFANLYALMSFALLLAHSLLGLDVAFVSSFISPDNGLVLLLLAAATLVLFEPLRAALSAQAFVDARSRRDGADLHAAVDAAVAVGARGGARTQGLSGGVALGWLLLASANLSPGAVRAQGTQPTALESSAPASGSLDAAQDEVVHERLQRILEQREFRDFAESDSRTVRDLLERLFKWLDDLGSDQKQPDMPALHLPRLSPYWVMALALVAVALIALSVRARRAPNAGTSAAAVSGTPEVLAAEAGAFLDEAARLASTGDARAALRALYLATLAALDRARLIEYEPSKTNGQYLRALPRGELRQAFAAFTRIFDHKWYGHEPATVADYAACRALADRICATERA